MSAQTDKERVIAELVGKWCGGPNEGITRQLCNPIYEAGYAAALERAAQIAGEEAVRGLVYGGEQAKIIAAAIRALKYKAD